MASAIQLFLWRSRLSSPSSLVKLGIKSIEVFAVQMILGGSQGFTEAFRVKHGYIFHQMHTCPSIAVIFSTKISTNILLSSKDSSGKWSI